MTKPTPLFDAAIAAFEGHCRVTVEDIQRRWPGLKAELDVIGGQPNGIVVEGRYHGGTLELMHDPTMKQYTPTTVVDQVRAQAGSTLEVRQVAQELVAICDALDHALMMIRSLGSAVIVTGR